MPQIIHIPARFMQARPLPHEFRMDGDPTPSSIAKAKAEQRKARAEFLSYIADPTARARYEATFAAEEAEAEARAIERMADAISQHRFSCPTLCLPTETRTKVFALAKYGVELLDREG